MGFVRTETYGLGHMYPDQTVSSCANAHASPTIEKTVFINKMPAIIRLYDHGH